MLLILTVRRRLLDPLEILLAPPVANAKFLEARLSGFVNGWVTSLLGDDDAAAFATASQLLAALIGDVDEQALPRSWWGTPFGKVMAPVSAIKGQPSGPPCKPFPTSIACPLNSTNNDAAATSAEGSRYGPPVTARRSAVD